MDKKLIKLLLDNASLASKQAYAPYSRYSVGCAILLEDNSIITGVNIENASYSVTLCAERAAMATVVSAGLQHLIKAVAVVTSSSPPGAPCGVCRQFLSEFLKGNIPILLGNMLSDFKILTMDDLLPLAFSKADLI
jgi:cytidine deaminase